MNTSAEQIKSQNRQPAYPSVDAKSSPQHLRITLPQSVLTPEQLTELAGMISRFSPRYALRLLSATQLEIASYALHRPLRPERFFKSVDGDFDANNTAPSSTLRSELRVHVPGAQLRVRQLRVLAALMHGEGLRTVRIADSESLIVENTWLGRESVLRLGLREAGLISV